MPICEWFSIAQECDIPNWIALIIELVIGVILAVVFFIRQQKQGNKLKTIIDEQENFRQSRKKTVVLSLIISLESLRANIINEKQALILFYDSKLSPQSKVSIKETIIRSKKDMDSSKSLENIINISFDVLEPHLLQDLSIIHTYELKSYSFDDEKFDVELCDNTINLIDKIFDAHLQSYVVRHVKGNTVTWNLVGYYEK